MKRILMISIVVTILLALMVGSALAAQKWFAIADLSTADLDGGGYCWSFNELYYPGGWGGMQDGDAAVTAALEDNDPAGYCSFNAKGKAISIEMRVLDGIADDSFAVYMKNPKGILKEVYTYTDQGETETWNTHTIDILPKYNKNYGTIIKIEPTGELWSGFETYGQLAVDYIAISR